jgi:hypothetical protein
MRITMRQLVDGWQALQKLGTVQAGQGLTLKQAFWIGKLATAGEAEIKQLDALRMKLFEVYGERVDDQMRIKEERIADFTRQMEEMLDSTIELPGQPISIDDLNDNLPLSAADLVRLNWLITEG